MGLETSGICEPPSLPPFDNNPQLMMPCSIGSYVWDAKWSPDYHPSLGICLGALGLTTILGGTIRQMIITRNKEMLADELKLMTESNRVRIEEAAKLEGISFEDAMARRRGFKLLY